MTDEGLVFKKFDSDSESGSEDANLSGSVCSDAELGSVPHVHCRTVTPLELADHARNCQLPYCAVCLQYWREYSQNARSVPLHRRWLEK